MDNNFSALLLGDTGLRGGAAGLGVCVRLPWYRSLPLSVVEVAKLAVDGRAIAPSDVRFELNGRSFELAELPDLTGEFWFVLDDAVLRVPGLAASEGDSHAIELQLNLYPPYIPHLTWVTRAAQTLRVQGDARVRS